ncbi:S-adenosyl-L-methionine-dependent methyltransferase [Lentinula edodes]|uniref:S-adenosyl-L-methionine-dependent methyltransferase n=1 Tax=Lentinula lateritia TaxID=40482 RepID=A0A9W9DGV9_9AGAR|nr:S-adenosyl-L-methionine-dependent methyltransferase [Lentinula edodes]
MAGRKEVQALLELISRSAIEALDEYEKQGDGIPSIYEDKTHPLDDKHPSLQLKKVIRNLEGACDQLCATLAPPLHTIVNRAQDYYWSCLRVAAHKRIADILDQAGSMDLVSLANSTGIQTTKLRILMRTLAARHCFYEVSHDMYTNTRLSLVLHSRHLHTSYIDLLTKEGQESAGYFQEYLDATEYSQCNDTSHTVFTYSVKATGFQGTVYDWMKANSDRRAVRYHSSMPSMNDVMGTMFIIQAFPWEKISTVCDVGCGNGSFAWPLVQNFPQIEITLFDLDETLEAAKKDAMCLSPELQTHIHFQSGDFFLNMLPKSLDIYYLRNIIHNWPDSSARLILQSIRDAMGPQSRILIHDYTMNSLQSQDFLDIVMAPWPLLPDFGYGNMRLHYQDLTMLFMYNSKERTLEEVGAISQDVGLKLYRVWDLGETTVLEFGQNDVDR